MPNTVREFAKGAGFECDDFIAQTTLVESVFAYFKPHLVSSSCLLYIHNWILTDKRFLSHDF